MSSTNHHHNKPAALQDRCSLNLDALHNGPCKAQWLHVDPPVLTVDNFFTEQECDDIRRITISPPPAGVVRVIKLKSRLSESKSNNQGTAVRLSTTLYVRYGAPQVAPLLRSRMQLFPDIQLEQTEEVQLVRYMGDGQGFGWHEDALSEQEATRMQGGNELRHCWYIWMIVKMDRVVHCFVIYVVERMVNDLVHHPRRDGHCFFFLQ